MVELRYSFSGRLRKTRGEVIMTADTIFLANQVADVRSTPDKKLFRAGLLMLLFMTAAFGAATWNTMQDLSIHVKAVPVVLFVVVCILVARLYVKVDEIAAVQRAAACAAEPALGLGVPELSGTAEIRDEIWKYWDKNGTGRKTIDHVRCTYGISTNAVQHLLEGYDARWRKQVAMLYSDNPRNEYMACIGVNENQVAADALRLNSGLPIYPVAGVWLCSECRSRPCRCR
jgi:hypothetical protein